PFELDDDLENELQDMEGAIDAYGGSAFSLDVDPFALPALQPGERYRLTFNLTIAEDQISQMVNVPIQFAAGSNSTSHPLTFFQGYQDTITLPQAIAFLPGDFDQDGDVDSADFSTWGGAFGTTAGADVDGDGDSDGDDFLALQRQFTGGASPAVANAVPEPASAAFAVACVIGGLYVRRR
ncbi:MAG: hypothetical protein KDA61_10135, partial [Planctomycetales bacterium]|nr:hypothetical protein [Planctomycetales bacterium]